MIRIEQRNTHYNHRCTACFENTAAVTISIGREDDRHPDNFAPGGYTVFRLCEDCAKTMSENLTDSEKEAKK